MKLQPYILFNFIGGDFISGFYCTIMKHLQNSSTKFKLDLNQPAVGADPAGGGDVLLRVHGRERQVR